MIGRTDPRGIVPVSPRTLDTRSYARQLVVGDGLSLEASAADYHDGVLTLTIPVAEQAKPRRIDVGRSQDSGTALTGGDHKTISGQAAEGDQPVGATAR
jgi:hypothetical protein